MPKAAGIGLVLEEPIVRIFLWRRHGKSRTRHRTHRAETLAEKLHLLMARHSAGEFGAH